MDDCYNKGAVTATALGFLVAAAVDKSAASSNALVGLLATLLARFSLLFLRPFL